MQSIRNIYQFKSTLGIGNFAKVKKALNIKTKATVAIKIIDIHKIDKKQLQKELWAAKNLMHLQRDIDCSHLTKIYDIIFGTCHVYIVMEFVSGGDLFDYVILNNKLPLQDALVLFQQLICGVQTLHEKLIVHRDLKLENILISENVDGINHYSTQIKISDFGFAKRIYDGRSLKTACGSPQYAAPELLSATGYSGPEVDVWSCGVILYVMLYGHYPFDDASLPRLYQKIKNAHFTTTRQVPDAINQLLRKMLDPNPVKRIQLYQIAEHSWISSNPASCIQPFLNKIREGYIIDESLLWDRKNKRHTEKKTAEKMVLVKANLITIPCTYLDRAVSKDIMDRLCDRLRQLNFEWKTYATPYKLKIRSREMMLKVLIQLYQDKSRYVLDTQIITGSSMQFLELCNQLVETFANYKTPQKQSTRSALFSFFKKRDTKKEISKEISHTTAVKYKM